MELFKVTLPETPPKFVSLMGEGKVEYGAILYNSLEEFQARFTEDFDPDELWESEEPPDLPAMLGFSLSEPDECPLTPRRSCL